MEDTSIIYIQVTGNIVVVWSVIQNIVTTDQSDRAERLRTSTAASITIISRIIQESESIVLVVVLCVRLSKGELEVRVVSEFGAIESSPKAVLLPVIVNTRVLVIVSDEVETGEWKALYSER